MALKKQIITRVFNYAGVRLPDPDPSMSLTEVRDFFANTGRPELTSAEVRGPEVVGTDQVFTLHRVTGTKGAALPRCLVARVSRKDSKTAAVDLRRLVRKRDAGAIDEIDCAVVTRLTLNKGDTPIYLPSGMVRWTA